MTDDEPIIANEHVLDHQTDDALPLDDVKRVGGFTQSREKGQQRFRETQVRRSFSSLFGDRLPLRPQRTLALTQGRHPLAQLLQRQQFLLIGGQQTLDAFPTRTRSRCSACSRCRVGSAARATARRRSSSC